MKTLTAEIMKQQRDRYMNKEITHEEYYSWLATEIHYGIPQLTMIIKENEIKASTDQWFNDIPLKRWDNLDHYIRFCARQAFKGAFSWSLSDSVCVAKAIARQIRGH